MKKLILLLSITLSVYLSGCGSGDSGDKQNTNSDSTAVPPADDNHDADAGEYDEIPDHASENMEGEQEFEAFYKDFAGNAGDMQYLRDNIVFPYYYASMQNYAVEAGDFDSDTNDRYVFQTMTERDDAKLGAWDGEYLNGYLEEQFKKTYGDLSDLYVVEFEAAPTGYLAYFKAVEGTFQFIGCELIEIGD